MRSTQRPDQTNPKSPISSQQITIKRKMKFNWKANWEILLVFVIIIVGIVITTIAAIRSKDKHLLLTPDESGDFGGVGGSADPSSSAQVPHLPQTDFQLQDVQVLKGSTLEPESEGQNSRHIEKSRQLTSKKYSKLDHRPFASHDLYRNEHQRESSSSVSNRHNSLVAGESENGANATRLPVNEAIVASHPKSDLANNNVHQRRPSQPFHMTTGSRLHNQKEGTTDNYDAMSTEPTPNQALRSNGADEESDSATNQQQQAQLSTKPINRNYTNRRKQQRDRHDSSSESGQLNSYDNGNSGNGVTQADQEENVEDMHTTRNLINAGNGHSSTSRENGEQAAPHQLQGPYELSPHLHQAHNQQHNQQSMTNGINRVQHSKLAQQQPTIKIEQATSLPPTSIDSEDMMTSYTRVPNQNNATEALLRDYNLASANFFANNNNNSTPEEPPVLSMSGEFGQLPTGLGNQATVLRHQRPHSSGPSAPFAMLLNDLIKLSRSNSLVDGQAKLEKPANSRPQYSILQQLRSLPSPLLALFQGNANSGGSSSPFSGAQQAGDIYNQLANHDMSESNQHYHKISMVPSELSMILSRSLQTTNPLPAFPPPKGTHQAWIPSNMGGTSVLSEAASSNADFVAGNTAGFLRGGLMASGFAGQQQPTNSINQQLPGYAPAQHLMTDSSDLQPVSSETTEQQRQQVVSTVGQINKNAQSNGFSAPSTIQHPSTSDSRHTISEKPELNNQNVQLAPNVQQQLQQQPQFINPNKIQRVDVPQSRQLFDQNLMLNQVSLKATGGNSALNGNAASQPSLISSNFPQQRQQLPPKLADTTPQQQQRQASRNTLQTSSPQGQPLQLNTVLNRVKRSTVVAATVAFDEPPSGRAAKQHYKRARKHVESGAISNSQEEMEEDVNGDDGEYLDSRPMSILKPDGQPTSGNVKIKRVRGVDFDRHESRRSQNHNAASSTIPSTMESSSSQRLVNHADLNENVLHHYTTRLSSKGQMRDENGSKRKLANGERYLLRDVNKSTSKSAFKENKNKRKTFDGLEQTDRSSLKKDSMKQNRRQKLKDHTQPDTATASSGLMSKLLGTASTNDELEEELDNDEDDSANERRKEELEDAEFGIVNDERSNGPSTSSDDSDSNNIGSQNADNGINNDVSRLSQDALSQQRNSAPPNSDSPIRSAGSTDNNAYAKRQQQQRSDVEFYGHPGEETRQLKYGILGSGNYEVVNGGVYPDIDESTAAGDSVANYVRKPNMLLTGLPKLLHAAGSNDVVDNGGVRVQGNPFMPGGRVGGGFMRGASAFSPDGMISLFAPRTTSDNKILTTNPLLGMLDEGNSGYLDPNLVAQLGSSGSSTRTLHANRDIGTYSNDKSEQTRLKSHISQSHNMDAYEDVPGKKKRRLKFKHLSNKQENLMEDENNESDDRYSSPPSGFDGKQFLSSLSANKQDSISTINSMESSPKDGENAIRLSSNNEQSSANPHPRTNQFHSYQLLPSKKVTIYSDQDLDSAPSEQVVRQTVSATDKLIDSHRVSSSSTIGLNLH